MTNQPQQLHNRWKLPMFVVFGLLAAALAIYGAATDQWGLVVVATLAAVGTLAPIWVILTGRGNPWWMRSPLDPDPPNHES